MHEEMKLNQHVATTLLQEMARRADAALKIVIYNFKQQRRHPDLTQAILKLPPLHGRNKMRGLLPPQCL